MAGLPGLIAIRDSKNPAGPVLTFEREAFATLLSQLRADGP